MRSDRQGVSLVVLPAAALSLSLSLFQGEMPNRHSEMLSRDVAKTRLVPEKHDSSHIKDD